MPVDCHHLNKLPIVLAICPLWLKKDLAWARFLQHLPALAHAFFANRRMD